MGISDEDWEIVEYTSDQSDIEENNLYFGFSDLALGPEEGLCLSKTLKSSDCGDDAQTSDVGRRELMDKQRETEKAELKDDKIALENTTIASIREHKVEHDQIQRYGPGLSSRIHYQTLDPEEGPCLSKTLILLNVHRNNPRLYIDAYETSILMNSPEIIEAPPLNFSMNLLVFDEYDRVYNMLLSECSLGKMAYSITADWDTFVKVHKLKAGDDIFFHRINPGALNASDDYCYILKYVRKCKDDTRDTKEVSPYENTADKNKENMSGPGSRPLPREACCLSKTLTRITVQENGRFYFDAYDAMTLTDSPGIVEYPPGTYSKDLLVFDEDDRRYTMNLSNHISERETRFCLNTDWNTFCKTHDLKQGDRLMFYRVVDASVSEEAYYVLKYSRKNTL